MCSRACKVCAKFCCTLAVFDAGRRYKLALVRQCRVCQRGRTWCALRRYTDGENVQTAPEGVEAIAAARESAQCA